MFPDRQTHLMVLARIFRQFEIPLLDMAYSPCFERLVDAFAVRIGKPVTDIECWQLLVRAERDGLL